MNELAVSGIKIEDLIYEVRGKQVMFDSDLAKLYHSVIGNYDFIVNGLYELRDYDSTLNYSIFNGDSNKKIGGFIHYFIEVLGNDVDDIEFITGLLFLTMIPLHSENKNNQKMQFIKACEILKNTINGDD